VNPVIGQWYLHQDKGEMFRVTAYDERARTIDIQTFDGDVDEFDLEAWKAMPLERAGEPEDCTGPLDDVEVDDLGYSDTEMTAADWAEPLQPFQPPEEAWQDATDVAADMPSEPGEQHESSVAAGAARPPGGNRGPGAPQLADSD
jgi:hypothetical protein